MSETPHRRSTHINLSLSYASVGASRAEDLLKFPPVDSTPFQHEVLLGSGEDRFVNASATLMTWGAQRASGLTVDIVDEGDAAAYTAVAFGDSGVPQGVIVNEQFFAPDGAPYLEAGTLVRFRAADEEEGREMRVLSTIVEDKSVGFVLGSADEHGAVGETFFNVEIRDDHTVWAIARGFLYDVRSAPAKLVSRNPVKQNIAHIREQLVALTPAVQAVAHAEQGDAAQEADAGEQPGEQPIAE